MRTAASFLILLLLAAPASAFDCGKAKTRIEKTICANPQLKAADDAMAEAYGDAKALSTDAEKKMLARSQKRWIASRDEACNEQAQAELPGCLAEETSNRIGDLAPKAEQGPGYEGRLMPVFVAQDGAKGIYDVDVVTMRFVEPKTDAENLFNAYAAKMVKDAPLGKQADVADEENLGLQASLKLAYASPRLISAQQTFYEDGGGAHGNGGVENLNLDMEKGRALALSDILPQAVVGELRKKCKDQIIAQKKEHEDGYDPSTDDFLKDEVIAEHIGDLSRWGLTEKEATVSFDSYAIGAYAEGTFDCVFPMADLKAMALPNAPLP